MSRPVILQDDFSVWADRIKAELEILQRLEIRVGILGSEDSELLIIARVHEFGATITPRNAKNLAIPLKKSMRGKSPRDIENTWVLESNGVAYIVRDQGKDRIEFLFMLLPRAVIPERSFLRAGYDANKSKIEKALMIKVNEVIQGKIDAMTAAHYVGRACVDMIKKYMRTIGPPKSNTTLASAPGKTVPLFQSGRLQAAITYEVVKT